MRPPAPDPVTVPVLVLELALRVVALQRKGPEVDVAKQERRGLDRIRAEAALVKGDPVDPLDVPERVEFREVEHGDRMAFRVRILDGPRDAGLVSYRRKARGLKGEVRAHPDLVVLRLSEGPPREAIAMIRRAQGPRARWPGSGSRECLAGCAHEQKPNGPLLHLRGELLPQMVRG